MWVVSSFFGSVTGMTASLCPYTTPGTKPESRSRLLAREPSSLRCLAVTCALWVAMSVAPQISKFWIQILCSESVFAIGPNLNRGRTGRRLDASLAGEQRSHRFVVVDSVNGFAEQF